MTVDPRPAPPVHPGRIPPPIRGLGKLLGLTGTTRDLSPQAQMSLLMARTRPEAQTYAGTVPHAEVRRRRAAGKRARVARRTMRGRR